MVTHLLPMTGSPSAPAPPGSITVYDCSGLLPIMNPTGYGSRATARISIEVWELVIDMLRDEPRALMACELVCKRWSKRCQYFLRKLASMSILSDQKEVVVWAKTIHAISRHGHRVKRVHISGDTEHKDNTRSLSHLGTFTAMLAGCLPSLRELFIKYGHWYAGAIHGNVFLHLTTFSGIVDLRLLDVTFPSIVTFGRLICSLRSLCELKLENVSFTNESRPSSALLFKPPPSLTSIEIWWISSVVLRALTETTIVAFCQHLNFASDVSLEVIQTSALQELFCCTGHSLRTLSPIRIAPALAFLTDIEAETIIEDCVNLSYNPSLRYLRFHVDLNILQFDAAKTSQYHWIFRTISHTTTDVIDEIEISLWWILVEMDFAQLHYELRKVMEGCTKMDSLLSHPRYSNLSKITFSLLVDEGLTHEGEAYWILHAPLWFPKLLSMQKLKCVLRTLWGDRRVD